MSTMDGQVVIALDWHPDTRSNAQLQAQWVELRKAYTKHDDLCDTQLTASDLLEGITRKPCNCGADERIASISAQMQWIVDELETRRVKGIVIT